MTRRLRAGPAVGARGVGATSPSGDTPVVTRRHRDLRSLGRRAGHPRRPARGDGRARSGVPLRRGRLPRALLRRAPGDRAAGPARPRCASRRWTRWARARSRPTWPARSFPTKLRLRHDGIRADPRRPGPDGHAHDEGAGPAGAPQLRRHRSGRHPAQPGAGRLHRPAAGARARPRGAARGARAVGAARSRRRGLPGLAQVEVLHRGARRHQVHHLQRGRGRPGRVHEPLAARGRSARGARGDDHRRPHHRGRRGLHLLPRGVPAGAGAARRRHPPGRGGGLPRARRPGARPSLPDPREGGRGRVRLRRGDRADRVPRGAARHAAAASAVPRRQRALGTPHGHQQRGDPRLRGAHLPARRRLVRRVRHGEEQGHQDLRAGRQRPAAGAGRGPAGHDAAADDLRHRRRRRRASTGSRPSRPAVPPAAACPRTSSTSRWTTSRSRPRARSWAPAGSS